VLAVAAAVVAGCSSSGGSGGNNKSSGDLTGTITMMSAGQQNEVDAYQQIFNSLINSKVKYKATVESVSDFETQFQIRAKSGTLQVAAAPQPGGLAALAGAGQIVSLEDLGFNIADLEKLVGKSFMDLGLVNGKHYGLPTNTNLKSMIWYPKKAFDAKGYKVPKTWDDLLALSAQIKADGSAPWCSGVESGGATGWPATDWIEDIMLRQEGKDVYDQWVTHAIPFNDPRVVAATDRAGSILKNPAFVNGGIGDVKSIATTSFQEGGLPIIQNKCAMHRQASFYANQWPKGTNVAEDGDVFAFYFPPIDPSKGKPVLGGGEFVAGFSDRPEVQAVQAYLASSQHANTRAKLGNWVSANKGLDLANVANPIDKKSVQILQDANSVFRFDGSDLMPAAVGSGSEWKELTNWITGKDTKSTLDSIEASWPK